MSRFLAREHNAPRKLETDESPTTSPGPQILASLSISATDMMTVGKIQLLQGLIFLAIK